jgi:UDP-N-acetylmuramoylalanine--D-glutamate ligase
MDLNNKRVLVVGLGKSGVASALFLKSRGARVTVSDSKPESELRDEILLLLEHGITVETGGHGERTFRGQDLIVLSPGVPVDAPQLVQARNLGEPVIGEIELAAQFMAGPIVAITGANGKTTTTSLAGEIIAAGKFSTLVGGNIGTPAISLVDQAGPATWTVLEVSSFQLETIVEFRPRIAVILNITPDHLDRHKTFANYVNAKARVFENQLADDFSVLNADEPTTAGLADRTRAQLFWFSRSKETEKGAFVRGTHIYFRDGHSEREIMPLAEVPLKGAHNLENVLAGVSIGMLVGCQPEQIRRLCGISRPSSTGWSSWLGSRAWITTTTPRPRTLTQPSRRWKRSRRTFHLHLILGGKDKGSDYTVLADLLRLRVKRVYTIGAAAAKIESQIQGVLKSNMLRLWKMP